MKPNFFQSWKHVVPELPLVLERMQEKTIIAPGVAAYARIVPALFLHNYIIYAAKDSADIDVLRSYATIFCLEEKFPKAGQKVQGVNYLLGNYGFQAFLKTRRRPFRLLLYHLTAPMLEKLQEQNLEWIGNPPETYQDVVLKRDYRNTVKKLGLPHLPDWQPSREEFLSQTFKALYERWQRPVVVQRGDFEVGGEQGTFFIHTEEDWQGVHRILSQDTRYKVLQVSPFIEGQAVSMLACVTHLGVLTSNIHHNLIDVPESLHGQLATGVFTGNDWEFHPWNPKIEATAQKIAEGVGEFLSRKGFKGVFGLDFMYDSQNEELFPLECNPRFTGDLPMFSAMMMGRKEVPPLEFFHLMTHLNITERFDFKAANAKLKQRLPLSEIFVTPKGIREMKLPLAAGIYSYDRMKKELMYKRPGAFLWELKDDSEFIMIDSVPRMGKQITQGIPRLFKLIFPRSIARTSSSIEPEVGKLVTLLSTELRKNQG